MNNHKLYTRFNITLFNMIVSGSFLAGYSVTTFYLLVAYALSGPIRGIAVFNTWMGIQYEIVDPKPIEKLCEACYMYRFE